MEQRSRLKWIAFAINFDAPLTVKRGMDHQCLALLDGVTAEQAAAHPIPGAHSIWELTLHIAAWESACLRRLEGDPAQLTDEENFAVDQRHERSSVGEDEAELIDTHRRELLDAIANLDDSRLNEPIIDRSEIPFSSVFT